MANKMTSLETTNLALPYICGGKGGVHVCSKCEECWECIGGCGEDPPIVCEDCVPVGVCGDKMCTFEECIGKEEIICLMCNDKLNCGNFFGHCDKCEEPLCEDCSNWRDGPVKCGNCK